MLLHSMIPPILGSLLPVTPVIILTMSQSNVFCFINELIAKCKRRRLRSILIPVVSPSLKIVFAANSEAPSTDRCLASPFVHHICLETFIQSVHRTVASRQDRFDC